VTSHDEKRGGLHAEGGSREIGPSASGDDRADGVGPFGGRDEGRIGAGAAMSVRGNRTAWEWRTARAVRLWGDKWGMIAPTSARLSEQTSPNPLVCLRFPVLRDRRRSCLRSRRLMEEGRT
jgi:hypothetical protein